MEFGAKNQQQNTTTNQEYAGVTKEREETRRFDGGGLRKRGDTIVLGTIKLGVGVKN